MKPRYIVRRLVWWEKTTTFEGTRRRERLRFEVDWFNKGSQSFFLQGLSWAVSDKTFWRSWILRVVVCWKQLYTSKHLSKRVLFQELLDNPCFQGWRLVKCPFTESLLGMRKVSLLGHQWTPSIESSISQVLVWLLELRLIPSHHWLVN